MAFFTANSAASGGRVLMCGASLEPVRSAGASPQLVSVYCMDRLTVFGKSRFHNASFPLAPGVLQAAVPEVSAGVQPLQSGVHPLQGDLSTPRLRFCEHWLCPGDSMSLLTVLRAALRRLVSVRKSRGTSI